MTGYEDLPARRFRDDLVIRNFVTPLGYAPVAQRIERQPPELEVAGSNPVGGATSTGYL